jgi:iron(III) transport system ATP-binding protein
MSVSDRLVVMNHGSIEQVGPPREVYRNPASEFVANFVGRSNQFDGVIEPGGFVRFGPLVWKADRAEGMAPGTKVRVLIRPEDIDVTGKPTPDVAECTLGTEEYLGPTSRVRLLGSGLSFDADIDFAQLHALETRNGASIRIGVAPDRVLLFPAGA